MQMFGTRTLPPPSLLPHDVARAVEALRGAQARTREAKRSVGQQRRVGVPAARQRDVEATADALERGTKDPGPKHERQAVEKLADLERSSGAAELVERRARQRLDETIAAHADQINEQAGERMKAAIKAYTSALDRLDEALAELSQAVALSEWAKDPQSFAQAARVAGAGAGSLRRRPWRRRAVAAMRRAIEPPQRRPIPSPSMCRCPSRSRPSRSRPSSPSSHPPPKPQPLRRSRLAGRERAEAGSLPRTPPGQGPGARCPGPCRLP